MRLLRHLPFGVDPGRAVFALALSIILYVFALTESNPEATRQPSFTTNVEVVNVPPGLVVVDRPPPVSLRIRAPLDVFNRLRPESFVAQVDATRATAGVQDLPVVVRSLDPDVRGVDPQPASARLRLDEVQERSLPVRVNVRGQPPTGYQVGETRVDPARVTVSGAASVVSQATEAVVDVSVDNVTVSVNGVFTPRAVDQRSTDLRDLRLTPAAVNVEIPITQQAQFKEVGIRPKITGQPAPGYFLEPLTVDPPTATLVGDPSVLQGVNFVETQPIDVMGFTSPAVRTVLLAPPGGAGLLQQGQTVLVTIRVSPLIISQSLRVQPSVINVPPGQVLVRPPGTVDVTISGPAPTLTNLTVRDFRVVVDVSNRFRGQFDLPPQVQNLPSGMNVENISPATVTIALEDAPTPTPAPTQAPTPSPAP